jgi:hypothetical protein
MPNISLLCKTATGMTMAYVSFRALVQTPVCNSDSGTSAYRELESVLFRDVGSHSVDKKSDLRRPSLTLPSAW